jgi:hypothetical protein
MGLRIENALKLGASCAELFISRFDSRLQRVPRASCLLDLLDQSLDRRERAVRMSVTT